MMNWHHIMLVQVASHDQKASHFDTLDLTKAVVPLMTLLALCDTDTSINGIT